MSQFTTKLMSAKWWTILVVVATYCYILVRMADSVCDKDNALTITEFMVVFGPFALFAQNSMSKYFDSKNGVAPEPPTLPPRPTQPTTAADAAKGVTQS